MLTRLRVHARTLTYHTTHANACTRTHSASALQEAYLPKGLLVGAVQVQGGGGGDQTSGAMEALFPTSWSRADPGLGPILAL